MDLLAASVFNLTTIVSILLLLLMLWERKSYPRFVSRNGMERARLRLRVDRLVLVFWCLFLVIIFLRALARIDGPEELGAIALSLPLVLSAVLAVPSAPHSENATTSAEERARWAAITAPFLCLLYGIGVAAVMFLAFRLMGLTGPESLERAAVGGLVGVFLAALALVALLLLKRLVR